MIGDEIRENNPVARKRWLAKLVTTPLNPVLRKVRGVSVVKSSSPNHDRIAVVAAAIRGDDEAVEPA